jgi:N12 class adenine-specific DNA methylase
MKKIFILSTFLFFGLAVKGLGQTVYASDKGGKYHTADCNLSGDAKDMTLAAAKKAGKGACGMCKPDEHFKDKVSQCTGKTADGTRCKRMTSNKKGKCYQHQGA